MLLIRHAQSEFNRHYNATGRDPGIIDPRITDHGLEQAKRAALIVGGHPIHTVLASPFTRALQTATVIAERLGAQLLVEPLIRERGAFVCDIGRPRSELEQHWPHLDFGDLPEVWWHADMESAAAVARRAQAFRARMSDLPDRDGIAAVSHWGFILELTGHAVDNGAVLWFDPEGKRGTVPVG